MSPQRRRTDHGWRGFVHKNVYRDVWLLIITGVVVLALAQCVQLTNRVSRDEHRTCMIQSVGLPAGHQLERVMDDIYALITVKATSTAQKLAAKNEPLAVRAVVSDLTGHLAKYKAAEAAQPHTRIC